MKNGPFKSTRYKDFSFFVSIPAFLWLILFLYIPLLMIIGLSFVKQWDGLFPALGIERYFTFFDLTYFIIIGRSLLLALVTAFVCLLFAYPIAYYMAFRSRRWKNMLLFLLALPFGANFLILAYAWFFLLERTGLINNFLIKIGIISEPLQLLNTPLAIYVVMIYCYLPFMVLPIYAILEKFDLRLIDASLDLGATRVSTFWRVVLPLSMPGIQTGFFLVFIPAFGELVIPTLMGGGKFMYVGMLISHFFLLMRNVPLGAAFTCFSSIILLVVALLFYWRFKKAAS